jgi:RimJ/RimL family protein N-acetyltransferase
MLDFNFHIVTPRLTLSYINPNNGRHCDFVQELNNSPEMDLVNRHMPRAISTPEATREWLETGVATLEKTGYGRFLISHRPSDAHGTRADKPFSEIVNTCDFIGITSMQYGRFSTAPPIPDIGFSIMAKYYGKGYATEAAQGLMEYYREEKGQTAFAGYCDTENENSKKLLRRLGFEDAGVREVKGLVGEEVGLKCAVFMVGVEGGWKW